jgi:transglutaminase/protease-like cytokinesis protein 3
LEEGIVMPASPTRTKKALQELAKVFNKLASELTADLNAAINEIDSLKREVQRLKSGSGKTRKTSTFQKKSTSSKTSRPHPRKGTQPSTHTSNHESGHGTKPSNETGSFVFPHEPFIPSPPPEPTPPGNN